MPDPGLDEDQPSCSSQQPGQYFYHVKWIRHNSDASALVPIITQNENGPCPLIAIMNVLLLRAKTKLNKGTDIVTSERLMELLGDLVLSSSRTAESSSEEDRLNYEQNVQDGIAIFHKLQTGLDVNVKFSGVQDFEYTPECIVFDLLGIALYHGWLVDPQQTDLVTVTAGLGYNQLIEKIIRQKSSTDASLVTEALLAEAFLEKSASQLTYHGLAELFARLHDEELCVFFRNNHFSTLYKHKGRLYQLVTDQGFLGEEDVVWQSLDNVEGDCYFVDADFRPMRPTAKEMSGGALRLPVTAAEGSPAIRKPHDELSVDNQLDNDLLLALSLQEEGARNSASLDDRGAPRRSTECSDLELARRLQEEEDRQAAAAMAAAAVESNPSAARSRQHQQQQQPSAGVRSSQPAASLPASAEKKRSSCIIL